MKTLADNTDHPTRYTIIGCVGDDPHQIPHSTQRALDSMMAKIGGPRTDTKAGRFFEHWLPWVIPGSFPVGSRGVTEGELSSQTVTPGAGFGGRSKNEGQSSWYCLSNLTRSSHEDDPIEIRLPHQTRLQKDVAGDNLKL